MLRKNYDKLDANSIMKFAPAATILNMLSISYPISRNKKCTLKQLYCFTTCIRISIK